jgi:uncharacterized protein
MRWTPGERSSDIEDRRGEGGGGGRGFGGGGMRLGLGGIVIVGILSLVTGKNLFSFFDGGTGGTAPTERAPDPARDQQEEPMVKFVSFVLDDIQGTWSKSLRNYQRAKLVLFRDGIDSACGFAETASGPFYCPSDQKVYVDLGFFDDLKRRFGAPGDFAQAYVIAHEIGHHVQKLTGIEGQVRERQEARPSEEKALSVRLELQADCYAGIWAHSTDQRQLLEQGDVEEGLNAAAAVGDDRLQKQATGHVNPETFTHGSSAERMSWFKRGYESGDVKSCDTFAR